LTAREQAYVSGQLLDETPKPETWTTESTVSIPD
jgi:hypothetical protein